MRKNSLTIICAIFIILASIALFGCGKTDNEAAAKNSYQVVDDSGTVVKFDKKPERVLTLSAGTDSIVLGLLPGRKLVAINSLADDPASSNIVDIAKRIAHKLKMPTAEEILSLKPDVVIAYSWNKSDMIENLRDLGIKVVVIKGPASIDEIKDNITLVAAALGEKSKGQELISKMDNKMYEIKSKLDKMNIAHKKRIVLISLMTSYGGTGCVFDDICKHAEVINGVSEAGLHNGQALTKEILVKINPDLLIMPVYNDHNTFDINKHNKEFLDDPSLQTMTAIKNGKVFYPAEGYIYNCSQDVVFGIQEVAYAAYGDDFKQDPNQHLTVAAE